jgi:ABC-2 type transport system permease protein
MSQSYRQSRAFFAILKAALRSISKSPSAVVFTVAFPLVFILVFGYLGGGEKAAMRIAFSPATDSTQPLVRALAGNEIVQIIKADSAQIAEHLKKGTITALVHIKQQDQQPLNVLLQVPATEVAQGKMLELLIRDIIRSGDELIVQQTNQVAVIEQTTVASRKFNTIDFILPGQLGFSLLAASIFGTAFVFFNLRSSLVLKRFFATPVKRSVILLAEGTARMIFQLFGALCIILIGRYFFGYTLVHGVVTIFNMLLLCAMGLLVFMSFGFIISGIAKSESTIPPLSNIFTLPQFLLAGTFFAVEAFPSWLQPVSRALPLTYLNDALRQVAFEGASLWEVRLDIAVLILWGGLGYFFAARAFKWE